MNKKISLGAAIAYMAIVAAVAFSLTMIYSMNLFNVKMTGITEREKMYSSLHEVDLYVRENYYGSINEEALQEAIARGYIDGLEDSNARYFTAAEYEAYTQSGSGKYVGVGLVTEMDSSGYLLVREVYPDSPAQMAGIKVGALITNVNGTRVTENNNESMAGRLRGEAGTKVTLTIQQDSQENNYELTLRAIEVPTVKTTMVSEDTAYISFTEWSGTTADQFIAQLNALKAQEVKGILLDVRGVTSNELSYAVRLLDPLLPSGTVAYSRDKDGNLTAVAESDANSWDIPLVVLADETTGGTTELFVMALQDFGRAKVVGAAPPATAISPRSSSFRVVRPSRSPRRSMPGPSKRALVIPVWAPTMKWNWQPVRVTGVTSWATLSWMLPIRRHWKCWQRPSGNIIKSFDRLQNGAGYF